MRPGQPAPRRCARPGDRASSRAAYSPRVSAGRRGCACHDGRRARRRVPPVPPTSSGATATPAHQHHDRVRCSATTTPTGTRGTRRSAEATSCSAVEPGTGRAERHDRGRVEVLPAVAGEPHLDPGVGVVGMDLVEVGDRVEAAGHVAHRLAGGDAEGAQHDGQRGRDLLAESHPVAEEELVHGVRPGRERRNVLRVVRVRADPADERLHLVVGRGVVGGHGARQGERRAGRRAGSCSSCCCTSAGRAKGLPAARSCAGVAVLTCESTV